MSGFCSGRGTQSRLNSGVFLKRGMSAEKSSRLAFLPAFGSQNEDTGADWSPEFGDMVTEI